jgi:protein transport protein SEC61 subunit beta
MKLTPSNCISYVQSQSGRGNTKRRAAAGGGPAAGRAAGGGSTNILQFYTDDSPGLQVGPTTVLIASLSFVGIVVLLHIWGKFRM